MPSIEYVIRTIALADSAIATKIATRWYPAPLPENPTYRSVTYQQISQINHSSHDGTSNLATTRLQLLLWGLKYDDLVALRDDIKRVLRDFRGVVSGVRIDRVIWENDISLPEPETNVQQRVIDLRILHWTPD